MKPNRNAHEEARRGISLDASLPGLPDKRLEADVSFLLSKRNRAPDWDYLIARIRRVAAARPPETPGDLAETIARLVFADVKTESVEVALRTGCGSPDEEVLRRVVSRSEIPLGPTVPCGHGRLATRTRLAGEVVKALSRPFHALFPKKRWTLPAADPARRPPASTTPIPRIFWQTNFTDRCSLPVWLNYRRNRRLSADFEYRWLGHDARDAYVRNHAPERVARAYFRLTDGAAQADLWRLVALYSEGGVYLDIDGSLVRPLADILAGRSEVFLWDRKRFSNYFMATVPGNPLFAEFIDCVVDRIENHHVRRERTVFYVTGPGALEEVLDGRPDTVFLPRQSVALQGAFTNEHFQYIDRPNSKWTHNPDFISVPSD